MHLIMFVFLRFEQHLLGQVPWSIATSPALALIRLTQLLLALFTFQLVPLVENPCQDPVQDPIGFSVGS